MASLDIPGSKSKSNEGNTAVQNDGIVRDFENRVCVLSTCRAIARPLTCATSTETALPDKTNVSMAILGSKHNAKEGNTAAQNDGFVHKCKKCAYVFGTCRAITRPLNSAACTV